MTNSRIVALLDSIKADHGFNMDSKSVRNLLQVMSELSPPERRPFTEQSMPINLSTWIRQRVMYGPPSILSISNAYKVHHQPSRRLLP